MNLPALLFAALGPLVGGRAYPAAFPQDCKWPAIRYTFVGGTFATDICGDGGDETADHRIQIDGVARTYDEMRTLRAAIFAAMAALDPPAVAESAFEDYESDEKRHRVSIDFEVSPSSEPAGP